MDTARKTVFLLFFLVLLPVLCHAMQETEPTAPGEEIRWTSPEAGMDTALLAYKVQVGDDYRRHVFIRALRFDTARYDFALFSSRWEGQPVRTMREWADSTDIAAATNACMYQKDGVTATGYMRSGSRTNNARVVKNFGSFFVSGPRLEGLPRAAVLDRNSDDWEELLPLYDTVVQNFRLMGPEGQQIWPEKGPRHAVAAVAEDKTGRILFLHCSDPVSVHEFVDALNAHKRLLLKSAMYVEGGSDATVMLKSGSQTFLWNGMSPASIMLSSRGDDIPLPNILGALRR